MIHKFIKGNINKTFVLFHGTGGDIDDLVSIAKYINPNFNVLTIRGEVKENGMNRYFKRFSDGSFDYLDLENRTSSIISFIIESSLKYDFDLKELTAIGYSNGANMISSILLNNQELIKNAILFHPTIIKEKNVSLKNANIYITYGNNDPICKLSDSLALIEMYKKNGANVTKQETFNGHRLIEDEIINAKKWLDRFYK